MLPWIIITNLCNLAHQRSLAPLDLRAGRLSHIPPPRFIKPTQPNLFNQNNVQWTTYINIYEFHSDRGTIIIFISRRNDILDESPVVYLQPSVNRLLRWSSRVDRYLSGRRYQKRNARGIKITETFTQGWIKCWEFVKSSQLAFLVIVIIVIVVRPLRQSESFRLSQSGGTSMEEIVEIVGRVHYLINLIHCSVVGPTIPTAKAEIMPFIRWPLLFCGGIPRINKNICAKVELPILHPTTRIGPEGLTEHEGSQRCDCPKWCGDFINKILWSSSFVLLIPLDNQQEDPPLLSWVLHPGLTTYLRSMRSSGALTSFQQQRCLFNGPFLSSLFFSFNPPPSCFWSWSRGWILFRAGNANHRQ